MPPAEPGDDERLRLSDVGKLARRTRRRIVGAARADDRVTFRKLLVEHLATAPDALDVVEETWPAYEHVNVQAGLDAWLDLGGRTHRVLGAVSSHRHMDIGLSEMMRAADGPHSHLPSPGNVSRKNLPCGPDGEVKACVTCAVYLVEDGERRAALLLRSGNPEFGRMTTSMEIATSEPEYGAQIAEQVRQLALDHNVYRGHVVSFGHDVFGERGSVLTFHQRARLTEAELILPPETVSAISRQVVGVARHRAQLLAARQHLKRGLLLYGPPGVGKTHTVRYLTSQLTDTTIVLLSGNSLHMIGEACSVARSLQPAMIVVEDVDLIAEERDHFPGQNPVLFQLLNEMDGLAEDADVVFLLTTNRADILEPALAQRPGRVDQAVELTLPDTDARRQLFALYRGDLEVDESRLDDVLAKTDGVTASFLKELLRRSAVLAAERGPADEGRLTVSADDLDGALSELLDTRNAMTRTLLGGGAGPQPVAAKPTAPRKRATKRLASPPGPKPGIAPLT